MFFLYSLVIIIPIGIIGLFLTLKPFDIQYQFHEHLKSHYPALYELNKPVKWGDDMYWKFFTKERYIRAFDGVHSFGGFTIYFPIAKDEASKVELQRFRKDEVIQKLRNSITQVYLMLLSLMACMGLAFFFGTDYLLSLLSK